MFFIDMLGRQFPEKFYQLVFYNGKGRFRAFVPSQLISYRQVKQPQFRSTEWA